jgi:hypothetical protein
MTDTAQNWLIPKDGDVVATAYPTVTEKEINDDRELVIQRLDAAYMQLTDSMQPYQRQWDADPATALWESAKEGAASGASGWGEDLAEMFTEKMWTELGSKVKNIAGSALDGAADYSQKVYNDIVERTTQAAKSAGEVFDHPDKTVKNWAWWQSGLEQLSEEAKRAIQARIDAEKHAIQSAMDSAGKTLTKAQKIYKHRDAILGLPELLVRGDPKPVQAFVDTVLMDIDPELAKEIRNDPNFYVVLEIIADHDSILSYLSYVGLMMEAIPPNFYGYLAAKGGVYVICEVLLLLVTALLSAGAAAGARVTMLVARLAASSAKVSRAARKIEKAIEALNAFIRAVEDFVDAAKDLRVLGEKLRSARQRNLVLRGNTKSTISAKKKSIRRDRKCRLCGSPQHTTPRHRLGTIEYR